MFTHASHFGSEDDLVSRLGRSCNPHFEFNTWSCAFSFGNFIGLFLVLWEVFVIARVGLDPLCCQILYHHGISMIVPRFTFFTENFVICGFKSPNCSALSTTVPARLLQNALVIFCLQADIEIWVLRKVRVDTMRTRTRLHFCSRLHW